MMKKVIWIGLSVSLLVFVSTSAIRADEWDKLTYFTFSQPVEIPAIRELLTDTAAGQWAQMIIRVGHGPPAAATPRRPISDILEEEVA